MKLFVFYSSKENDTVNQVNVFTKDEIKALSLAKRYFAKCNAEGVPIRLAL